MRKSCNGNFTEGVGQSHTIRRTCIYQVICLSDRQTTDKQLLNNPYILITLIKVIKVTTFQIPAEKNHCNCIIYCPVLHILNKPQPTDNQARQWYIPLLYLHAWLMANKAFKQCIAVPNRCQQNTVLRKDIWSYWQYCILQNHWWLRFFVATNDPGVSWTHIKPKLFDPYQILVEITFMNISIHITGKWDHS